MYFTEGVIISFCHYAIHYSKIKERIEFVYRDIAILNSRAKCNTQLSYGPATNKYLQTTMNFLTTKYIDGGAEQ